MKLLSKAEPDAAPNGRTTRDHQGISRRERGEFNQLDHDFVELEQSGRSRFALEHLPHHPHDEGNLRVSRIRTLEAVTHRAENILSQLREGERELTAPVTTLLLETVDVVKRILASIEQTGGVGEDTSPSCARPSASSSRRG
ncbi:MAG: hypothetical protein R2748_02495 [Bryobacterales bacterium]